MRKLLVPAAAVLAALPTAASEPEAAAPAPRPNVVVVMSDDQTVESLRVMTNVDQLLARQGATFVNNFVSYSLCCPSRATFLSGQYAHNHGVMGNAPPQGGYETWRPSEGNSLPVWLQQAGYRTAHVGKYLNGYGRQDPAHVPAGWSEWYGSTDPSTYQYYNYTLNENGRLVKHGASAQDYQADVYTAKAVDAVKRLAPPAQPFFLSVAYLAPHSGGPRESDDPRNQATPVPAPRHRNRFASEPLPAPPSFNEADVSDKPAAIRRRPLLTQQRIGAVTENYRQRLESVLAVDEGVAAIVRALQDAGELANTLFVYTADNGFFHGEHRIPNGKVQLYEPSVRVPLVLRGPGIPRGVRLAQQSINVDLAATIVDATNARPGRTLDGVSLLPLLRDRTRSLGRDVLLETPGYAAIHTPRYVYAEHSTAERELYDLKNDPDELVSQHDSPAYAQLRSDLAQRLLRLRTCKGATCRRGPQLRLLTRCITGKRRLVRLVGADTRLVLNVDFVLRAQRVASDAHAPFGGPITGRAGFLRVRATLTDGRTVTYDRSVRACR
ncbi:MAG TPA: sulfatase [Gaiellaceae bacterium]|jgi:arylsulfatase A-like enzyme|nr:sulfatase [Gaiellaceae bacterium]